MMADGIERALEALAEVDAVVDRAGRRSLAPDRDRATSLAALFEASAYDDEGLRIAFAHGLRRMALAQLRAFPENVYWDLDAPATALLEAGRRDGVGAIAERSALVAALQDLFGRGSPIRFRYVHDFVYGFDWAKWIRRSGEDLARTDGSQPASSVPPFGLPFLRYTWRRGHELLQLIANDDEKYPKLTDGTMRNPFGFSREPADEARLFRDLAKRDLLPVRAWEREPVARWDRDYHAAREERAAALGL